VRRALVIWLLLVPALARADGDGGDDAGPDRVFDGSLPDASVGQGGADRDNPEGEQGADRVATSCRASRDCNQGFTCQNGRCNYVGYRKGERVGCLVGADGAGIAIIALSRALRRRGRSSLR
jgi:hypothetical protein